MTNVGYLPLAQCPVLALSQRDRAPTAELSADAVSDGDKLVCELASIRASHLSSSSAPDWIQGDFG